MRTKNEPKLIMDKLPFKITKSETYKKIKFFDVFQETEKIMTKAMSSKVLFDQFRRCSLHKKA